MTAARHLQFLLRPARGLRILFSRKDDWEPLLRDAFRGTRHRLDFDDLTGDTIARHDLVVPLTIADVKALCGTAMAAHSLLPLPSRASVALLDDKLAFHQAMLAAGLGRFVPAVGAQPFMPYILKRRTDECGAHTHVVGSWQRQSALAHLVADPDYFCQELVPGDREYATHILFAAGRIRYALTIEYRFAGMVFVKGRDASSRTAPVANPDCLDVFAQMLSAAGFRGLCCVNYKLVDGRPRVFEINPRCGFSLCPYFPRVVDALRPRWWQRTLRLIVPERTRQR